MSDAEHSGLSDHDLLLEIRDDVKEILKKKPDRSEVYSVITLLAVVTGTVVAFM